MCKKTILESDCELPDADPFTLIEHCNQPGSQNTYYYFHTTCFLILAGPTYGPRHQPLDAKQQYTQDEVIQRILKMVDFDA